MDSGLVAVPHARAGCHQLCCCSSTAVDVSVVHRTACCTHQVKSETNTPKHQQQPYLHSDTGGSNGSNMNSSSSSRNGGAVDSVEKLQRVLELCDECDVIRQPVMLGGLLLVPLLAWHHKVRRVRRRGGGGRTGF